MKNHHLASLTSRFKGRRIAVAGDFMLDHFIWGRASRLSAEAPVPVVESTGETFHPGGAGNVAANLAALGALALPFGLTGRDDAGRRLRLALRKLGIATEGLLADPDRCTTLKLRIIETARKHQVARVDTETDAAMSNRLPKRFAGASLAAPLDAGYIPDYD